MSKQPLTTALLVLVAFTLSARAQTPEAELIAARDTVWRAYFRNDTALLRRFIPPAAAVLEGPNGGRWSNRAEILSSSRAFVQSKSRLINLEFDDTQIAVSGHSALVRSTFVLVTSQGGRVDTLAGRATELFVRLGKTWVNPYWRLEPERGTEREIALPDTLGANFAIADSAKMRGSATDYDALVGTWEFRFQSRKPDGTYWAPFTGHWTFEKVPGGGLIEDRWRPDDPDTPMTQSLYTYRTFDPKRGVWQMFGSSATGGEVQPGLTWSDANARYVIQRNGASLSRIRYLAITPNRFLWRSDLSNDGGKTWLLDAAIMEARRIGK